MSRTERVLPERAMFSRGLSLSLSCLALGFLLVCSGGLLAGFWPTIYQHIIAKSLELTPHGKSFQIWQAPPVPMYIEFYFFNWTNPADILNHTTKPTFEELGPYRFTEVKEKTDIEWNANNTISFRQKRLWYYDAEHSNGSLDDELTTLNIIALTAAYVSRDWNYFLVMPLSQLLKSHSISITHTVGEFLFDGYADPLITMGKVGSIFSKGVEVPYDRFGWFYTRNGSTNFDGHFNMHTGVDDISQMGTLSRWNFQNSTKYYPGACGHVAGSAGELFPPHRQKKEAISIFAPDICRSMFFDYEQEVSVRDLSGYRYSAGARNLDNGTVDPSNACYCGGECVPSGVVNVSSCRFGAPAFVSYPHFYQADPYYLHQVNGMRPDKHKHSFDITLEPTTGIPLDVSARLQINVLMQPYKLISLFANLPKVFFPMMWFEQRATIPAELATPLHQLTQLATLGLTAALGAFAIGIIVISAVTFSLWYSSQRHKLIEKSDKMRELHDQYSQEVVSPLMVRPSPPGLGDAIFFDASSDCIVDSPYAVTITRRNSKQRDSISET